jgi:hypothetical protein
MLGPATVVRSVTPTTREQSRQISTDGNDEPNPGGD